jgi:hypothetical protein
MNEKDYDKELWYNIKNFIKVAASKKQYQRRGY